MAHLSLGSASDRNSDGVAEDVDASWEPSAVSTRLVKSWEVLSGESLEPLLGNLGNLYLGTLGIFGEFGYVKQAENTALQWFLTTEFIRSIVLDPVPLHFLSIEEGSCRHTK